MYAARIVKGTIIAIAAAALVAALVPGAAYAQGRGIPLPGIPGNSFLPGIPVPNLNDPGTANLIGSFLGSFLGTVIINNQYQDRNRYNYDPNHDPYRAREYDYRYYGPYNRGYNSAPYNRGYYEGPHR